MGTAILAISEQTMSSLHQVADRLGESAESLADRAIHQFLCQIAERKIAQENGLNHLVFTVDGPAGVIEIPA